MKTGGQIEIEAVPRRGSVLDGVLFKSAGASDTVVVNITGIHGNFYSNPFYYVFGEVLNAAGIDFAYAQVCDAFGQIRTRNVRTGRTEVIGSWNERFAYAEEDVAAWLGWCEAAGYRHIYLAGHSLGANKVLYYLSRHPEDRRVERFILLSPANVGAMTAGVGDMEKSVIRGMVKRGAGNEKLPFPFMGWVDCIAWTAHDWLWSKFLDNVHAGPDGDFSVAEKVRHAGALLIGTYDTFAGGDPVRFLENLNAHLPRAAENRLVFIPETGHTYQQKHSETAEAILRLVQDWRPATTETDKSKKEKEK